MKRWNMNIVALICVTLMLVPALTGCDALLNSSLLQNFTQNTEVSQDVIDVLPQAGDMEKQEIDLSVWVEKIPQGITQVEKYGDAGYVVRVTTKGYNPGMVILVGIQEDGTVIGTKCVESQETFGAEKTYGANFENRTLSDIENIDTIAGSTFTTKAYKQAVIDAVNAVNTIEGR